MQKLQAGHDLAHERLTAYLKRGSGLACATRPTEQGLVSLQDLGGGVLLSSGVSTVVE